MSDGEPRIRKENSSIHLTNDRYKTPHTSLLLFHFEPMVIPAVETRLQKSHIAYSQIEGKESEEMRSFSKNATFSRTSLAQAESRESGEVPARSMNNKEKWEFFAKPPVPMKEIYKLLELFAHKLDADVSTLPWDLCDQTCLSCCY